MSRTEQSQKLYRKGLAIVYTIAVLNVVWGVYSLFTGTSALTLIVQIVVSIGLFIGAKWARVLFLIGSALLLTIYLFLLPQFGVITELERIVMVTHVIYLIAGFVLLAFDSRVAEFFKEDGTNTENKG